MIELHPDSIEPWHWLPNLSPEQWGAYYAAIAAHCQEAEGRVYEDDDTRLLSGSTWPLTFSYWLVQVTRPIWPTRDTRPIWMLPTTPWPLKGDKP